MAVPYLEAHPPARRQYYEVRREPVSGVVAVHTVEAVMDTVGPDTGAENVASFIRRRSDPGSYHVIVDSDSTVRLVKDTSAAFHVAADGHNQHAWGIAAACRTTDWEPGHWWTLATLDRMAAEIVAFWRRQGHDPHVCARWITRDQAIRRVPGLVSHGTLQPRDRHDAWNRSPHRQWLEEHLVARIRARAGQAPPRHEEYDTMATADEIRQIIREELDTDAWDEVALASRIAPVGAYRDPRDGSMYLIGAADGVKVVRRRLTHPDDVKALQKARVIPTPVPDVDPKIADNLAKHPLV